MIGLYKLNMQACSICEMVEKQDKQRENIVYRRIRVKNKVDFWAHLYKGS